MKGKKIYIFIICFFVMYFLFCPGCNLFTWIGARTQIKSQEREMRRLNADINQMNEQIHSLMDNKDSLERFAREHFHFAQKGEDIYLIDE